LVSVLLHGEVSRLLGNVGNRFSEECENTRFVIYCALIRTTYRDRCADNEITRTGIVSVSGRFSFNTEINY